MSYVDSDTGYRYIWKPDHPNAKSNGYVAEHRLVMSEKLGRPLETSEHVHHKDGDKLNNEYENLEVVSGTEHNYIHQGKARKKECEYCGDEYLAIPSKYEERTYCSEKCQGKSDRKVERPSKEKLEEMLDETGFTQVGRKYGVSDNAVRAWAKNYDIL